MVTNLKRTAGWMSLATNFRSMWTRNLEDVLCVQETWAFCFVELHAVDPQTNRLEGDWDRSDFTIDD